MRKSVVLLSGGLDSAVNLAKAVEETKVILGITFDYGQKARLREINSAKQLLAHYGIEHEVISVPFLQAVTKTSLVAEDSVPQLQSDQLDDLTVCTDTAAKVWVPNRNGLFINIAAAYAETLGAAEIIVGFNREEAATFPDNTPKFIAAINQALAYSTQNKCQVNCYTLELDKKEIVELGQRLKLPFNLLWSCYLGGDKMCGTCESCQRLLRALKACHMVPLEAGVQI